MIEGLIINDIISAIAMDSFPVPGLIPSQRNSRMPVPGVAVSSANVVSIALPSMTGISLSIFFSCWELDAALDSVGVI